MNFTELILIALGLAMDAFAVSICKGLALKKIDFKKCCIVGLWFGGFQGLMPLLGYFLGKNFKKYIENVDHWVAFALLALIGANMIKEALSKNEEKTDDSLAFKTMFLLAVATSIDALAVGITFGIIPGPISSSAAASSAQEQKGCPPATSAAASTKAPIRLRIFHLILFIFPTSASICML